MTMTIDANQQRYGHLQFDNMSSYPTHSPQFSNPWASSTTAPSSHALYVASQPGLASNPMGLDRHAQQATSRAPATTTAPLAPYGSVPVTSASAGSPLSMVDPSLAGGQTDLLSVPQDLLSINRMPHPSSAPSYGESAYTTAASPVHATYAASPTSYDGMGYPSSSVRHNFGLAPEADPHRRYSQSSVSSGGSYDHQVDGLPPVPRSSLVDFRSDRAINDDRRSFQDAIEASHGMLSMKFDTSNQETPRAGVYNSRGRASGDSYGFPSAHSTSSSVSSTGFSPYYGSVDGSVSDYSTAGSDIESVGGSRTLPRPQGLMPNQPPAPQSMMGQFSSKVSSSTQKKHKCKVCDKRFTRPSSLQTHMYSHTGEKPFKCEVENCGRHFSVVSNLRRHRKVHKGDARSDAGSEDHTSD